MTNACLRNKSQYSLFYTFLLLIQAAIVNWLAYLGGRSISHDLPHRCFATWIDGMIPPSVDDTDLLGRHGVVGSELLSGRKAQIQWPQPHDYGTCNRRNHMFPGVCTPTHNDVPARNHGNHSIRSASDIDLSFRQTRQSAPLHSLLRELALLGRGAKESPHTRMVSTSVAFYGNSHMCLHVDCKAACPGRCRGGDRARGNQLLFRRKDHPERV